MKKIVLLKSVSVRIWTWFSWISNSTNECCAADATIFIYILKLSNNAQKALAAENKITNHIENDDNQNHILPSNAILTEAPLSLCCDPFASFVIYIHTLFFLLVDRNFCQMSPTYKISLYEISRLVSVIYQINQQPERLYCILVSSVFCSRHIFEPTK